MKLLVVLFVSAFLQPTGAVFAWDALEPGITHKISVEARDDNPSMGTETPTVLITYWVAYRLPANKEATDIIEKLAAKYPNDVRIEVYHRTRVLDTEEDGIAEIAREVFAQGGNKLFWRFHKKLVDTNTPHSLTIKDAMDLAVSMGISQASLERGLKIRNHGNSIKAGTMDALRFGIAPDSHNVAILVNRVLQYISRSTNVSHIENVVLSERKNAEAALERGIERKDLPVWIRRQARRQNRRIARSNHMLIWNDLLESEYGAAMPVERHAIAPRKAVSRGPDNAMVHVVVFMDPLNTVSKTIMETVESLIEQHDRDIRVDVRFLPGYGINRSVEFSRTIIGADMQGYAWAVMNKIIELRYGFRIPILQAVEETRGLDLQKLESDRDGPEAKKLLSEDIGLAHELGVYMAPAVFVNGVRIADIRQNRGAGLFLREAVKSELRPGLLGGFLESERRNSRGSD